MNHLTKRSRQLLAVCLSLLALLGAYSRCPLKASTLAAGVPAAQAARTEALHPATPLETKSQSGQTYGLYPAIVTSRPDAHMRVQVKIPALNIVGEWASPCVPVGSTAAPPVDSRVWVMFEQGNTHLPVWIGVFPGN